MKNMLSRRCLLVFTLLVLVVFGVVLYRLSILPTYYYVIVMGIILAIVLLLYKFENDKKNKHQLRVITLKCVHIFLSIMLVFASVTMLKGTYFLDSITTSANQTIEVDVQHQIFLIDFHLVIL